MSRVRPPSPAGPVSGPDDVRWAPDGLVPVIVQDASDGRILMLAYANTESLAATLATGEVHFFSRSRGRLWRKGETSGNVLRLRGLSLDCDGDALLATVDPSGPTCHRGTPSCFDADGSAPDLPRTAPPAEPLSGRLASDTRHEPAADVPGSSPAAEPAGEAAGSSPVTARQGFDWLEVLWSTIAERAASRPAGSYTVRLLAAGVDGPARKVAEEATEVLMAAKDDAVAEAAGLDRTALRAALAGEAADLLYHALVLLAERGLPPSDVIGRLRERHGR